MIQRNNNLSVLPFYENPQELSNERTYAYGEVYPLYTPLGSVPPFQILIPHGSETIANVYLRKYGEGESEATDIEQAMTDSGLRIARYTSYDIVIYPSVAPAGITTEEGRQQIIIELLGGGKLYSDWFTVLRVLTVILPTLTVEPSEQWMIMLSAPRISTSALPSPSQS